MGDEQPRNFNRARSANLWLVQENFLDKGMSDKLNMQEKLRVNIALKYMRKAHIEGSKADRERQMLAREVFSRPKTGVELPYSDSGAISIRNIDDIIKDAKTGFYLIKEQRMELKKSAELGNPKPIFKKLIDEIKLEFKAQKSEKKLKHQIVNSKPSTNEIPETDQQANNNNTLIRTRPRSAPSNRRYSKTHNSFAPPILIPLEGVTEYTNTCTNTNTNTNTNTMNTVNTPSNQNSSLKSKLWANIASAKTISDDVSHHSTTLEEAANLFTNDKMDRFGKRSRSAALRRSSSAFMLNLVDSDQQVMEALRRRNVVAEERVMVKIRKIESKVSEKQQKEEAVVLRERQLYWLVLVSLAARLSVLRNKSLVLRDPNATSALNKASKLFSAIHLIERWWRGKAIQIKIRKNPRAALILASSINMYVIRHRIRKKNRSADLIQKFLRDSTGISEVMGKIYVFRLNIIKIQRWIRMWIDIQIHRMRLIWMLAEKMSRTLVKADNVLQRQNERRMKASIAQVEGFSDAITEIVTVQRQLGKLLKDHEVVKLERERKMEEFMRKRERDMRQAEAIIARHQHKHHHHNNNTNNTNTKRKANTHTLTSASNNASNNAYSNTYSSNNATNNNNNNNNNNSNNNNHNNNNYKSKYNETLIWWRRVRLSKTYDVLRMILKKERKRHVLVISRPKIVAKNDDSVSTRLVMRFLKEPNNENVAEMLTKSITRESDQLLGTNKALSRPDFLFITEGGKETVAQLLATNFRALRFGF